MRALTISMAALIVATAVGLGYPPKARADAASDCVDAGSLDQGTCAVLGERLDLTNDRLSHLDTIETLLQAQADALPDSVAREELVTRALWMIFGALISLIVAPMLWSTFRWWKE